MSACIKLRRAAQVSAITGSLEHDSICNQCSHSFQQNCVVSTPYSLKLESLNLTSRKLPLHVSLHFSVFFTLQSPFGLGFNLKETFASSVCLIGSDMAKDCNQSHLEASTQIKSRRHRRKLKLCCAHSLIIYEMALNQTLLVYHLHLNALEPTQDRSSDWQVVCVHGHISM